MHLLLLLVAGLAAPLAAQNPLVVSTDSLAYNAGQRAIRLDNPTDSTIVVDSLRIRSTTTTYGGWGVTATDDDGQYLLFCILIRDYSSPDTCGPVPVNAEATVNLEVHFDPCPVCRGSGPLNVHHLEIFAAGDPMPLLVALDATGIVDTEESPAAGALALRVGPNPASDVITVSYRLDAPTTVRWAVADALGRTVRTGVDEPSAGNQSFELDTRSLAPGAYIVRLSTSDRVATRVFTVEH